MTMPFPQGDPIRARDGTLPRLSASTHTKGWTGWFGLNTMEPFSPFRHGYDDIGNQKNWATEPDWYRTQEHWRGWIPVKDTTGKLPTPKYLNFDEIVPYTANDDHTSFSMATEQCDEMVERYLLLENSVFELSIILASFQEGRVRNVPPHAQPFELTMPSYDSVEKLQRAGVRLKRGIADRMGWLAWALAVVPTEIWTSKLNPWDRSLIKVLDGEPNYRRRGYLLRIGDNWQEMNVGLWLMAGIPLFYEWNKEEWLQPHLSKLNPKLIAAGVEGAASIHEDADLQAARKNSEEYDQFLQPRIFNVEEHHEPFEMGRRFFIIDFQNWRRRELPSTVDLDDYTQCFYFRIDRDESPCQDPDGEYEGIVVTFWGWRKKNCVGGSGSPDNQMEKRATIDDNFRREIYRELYAPRFQGQYDVETGKRSDGSHSSPRSSEIPRIAIREELSDTERFHQRDIVQATNVIPNPQVFRLSVVQLAWRRFRLPFVDRHERQNTTNVYLMPLLPLSTLVSWNPVLLAKGLLILSDPRAEARFNFFATDVAVGITDISTLLALAIEHKFSFRIGVHERDIKLFPPHPERNYARELLLYAPDFKEPALAFTTPTAFHSVYTTRVIELLGRPHAPAFIGIGGSASWIAQHWGGVEIVARFMTGPSVQTTVFKKGASNVTSSHLNKVYWDDISADDIHTLFGYVNNGVDKDGGKWLYPPLHITQHQFAHWSGEWNEVMESMFTFITIEFSRKPCAWEPLSTVEWGKWMARYCSRFPKPKSLTDSAVRDRFDGRIPLNWNFKPLSEIYG